MINWKINSEYKKILNDDSVDKAILNCKRNNSIWELTEEDQHRVIAFILWKENMVNSDGEIDDKKVNERIEEMRNL